MLNTKGGSPASTQLGPWMCCAWVLTSQQHPFDTPCCSHDLRSLISQWWQNCWSKCSFWDHVGSEPSTPPLESPLDFFVMWEERIKCTPSCMACKKTLLVGGRKRYKDGKPLKSFIITKCMTTFFPSSSYNYVTRRRMGWENDQATDLGLLVSLWVT